MHIINLKLCGNDLEYIGAYVHMVQLYIPWGTEEYTISTFSLAHHVLYYEMCVHQCQLSNKCMCVYHHFTNLYFVWHQTMCVIS